MQIGRQYFQALILTKHAGFKTIFIQIINNLATFKKKRMNNRTEPWMNNEIIELMRERDKALHHKNRNKVNTELRENLTNYETQL